MRVLGKVLTATAISLLGAAMTPACAANDETIYIRQVQGPPAARTNGTCTYTPDPTALFLAEGSFDVGVADAYIAELLVGSQLQARGDTATGRAESNRGHLDGAVVTVTETNGAVLGEFTAVGTGFVDPQAGNAGSFGLLAVTLIDAPTAAKIGSGLPAGQTKLVIANVKAFGKTLGGVDLESGEFKFPIRVCNGCLVSFLSGDDPATPGLDCNLPLSTQGGSVGGITVGIPCITGQDELIPCQLCRETKAVCRGPAP
jgi:hypothetical protein